MRGWKGLREDDARQIIRGSFRLGAGNRAGRGIAGGAGMNAVARITEGDMAKSEIERLAIVETRLDALEKVVERLTAVELQIARLAQAQEYRNQLRDRDHIEGREDMRDMWAWLRWCIDRAVPLVALLLAAYIITQGGNG